MSETTTDTTEREHDLEALLHKIQSNLVDDGDDPDNQIHELKGILNETLGDMPFKIAISLVVLLNFIYICYDGFFSTRTDGMSTYTRDYECYCDPTDRKFYRIVMGVSTGLWIFFLVCYGVYSIFGRKHLVCTCHHHEVKAGNATQMHTSLLSLLNVLKKREKYYQAQLRELVTTKFLDDDHCESVRQHYYSTSLYWKTHSGTPDSTSEPSKACKHKLLQDECNSQAGGDVQDAGQDSTDIRQNIPVVVDIEDTDNHGQAGVDAIRDHSENVSINRSEARNAEPGSEIAVNSNNAQNDGEIGIIRNTGCISNTHSVKSSQSNNDSKQEVGKSKLQEPQTGRTQSNRWYCFMLLKVSLILLRFAFRLLIVPLLQLQLFNDYAWYCLLNNLIRDYCETETNKYYIGLDHSLVNYCVYILLLIALLFSFLINWFPKGIPQVVLLYKARRILINKKGQLKSQFDYFKLINEPDTDDSSQSPKAD